MSRNKYMKAPSRKSMIILIVCIITGFIIGFSYNLTKDNKKITSPSVSQEETYREDLIRQQERNKELSEELNELQQTIRDFEKTFASNKDEFEILQQEAEKLRLMLGEIPAVGQGIRITLNDAEYNPNNSNPNDYIVHDSHIFKVVNELKISGAEAISINGHRLKSNSYINCTGPVITIDGSQYPAPFVVEAVGNPEVLISSLQIVGGVFDQLINDQIVVTIEKKGQITMPSVNETQS
ncbi:DUF881 domain-containing protein [Ureibacillus acetophenoni]|uniref:Uncharacterized protein YlxW (UPF0749 family) n=1 Tax=Ureibacillus acetophenoni TaxID=614649 RepID=A0A285U059_9BACL|nr:DUF881 domain-containing protein [Ureibacillus acetophenoni]SOC35350.1 uncharacterized protein YlxW (UPF0749 family) [Ureibacillus acetophenoni]